MKTQAYIKDMLLQHRKMTEKAKECLSYGNLTAASENWNRVYDIEQQIIDTFAEGAVAISENKMLKEQLFAMREEDL